MGQERRRRGGQFGNHNRLKHGFCSKFPKEPLPEDALRRDDYQDEIDRGRRAKRRQRRAASTRFRT